MRCIENEVSYPRLEHSKEASMGSRANSRIVSNAALRKAFPAERRQRSRVESRWPVSITTPLIQIEGEVENIWVPQDCVSLLQKGVIV